MKKYFFLVSLLFLLFTLHANNSTEAIYQQYFPEIQELNSKNPIFKQYSQDVENSYKNIAQNKETSLIFYKYFTKEEDTLLSISSRCNISYDSIATINKIPSLHHDISNKYIYLPTVPGIFISKDPKTTIEKLLTTRNFENSQIPCYNLNGEVFYFVANEKFTSTERLFFLNDKMQSPLPQGILSSKYGLRKSPITGKDLFHNGIDLAADLGTPVLACLSGTIFECGYSEVYGNYVVILHDNNIKSFYAHLEKFTKEKNSYVSTGEIIGYVGITGLTTGPHLHFEVYVSGQTKDPWLLIN